MCGSGRENCIYYAYEYDEVLDSEDEVLDSEDEVLDSVPFLRAVGNANYRDDCHTGFDTAKPRGY
jgi:hypothetical protein